MLTIRSPVLRPARAAGLLAEMLATSAPLGRLRPRPSAISGVTACSLAPSHGRRTTLEPPWAEAITPRTMFTGIAKPMPCEPPDRHQHRDLLALRRLAGHRLGDHAAHHVHGNREADALRAAGAREDRGVDADQAAVDVDQRAAGVARIDRRVGLDEE